MTAEADARCLRTSSRTECLINSMMSRNFPIHFVPFGESKQGWQNTSILGIGLRFEVRIEVEVVFANRSPNRSDFFDAHFSLSTAFLEASEESMVCSLVFSFYRYLILGSNRRGKLTFGSITVLAPQGLFCERRKFL